MDMRSLIDLVAQTCVEPEIEVSFEEPTGRRPLIEEEVLDEKQNEILRKDTQSLSPDPGQKIISFVLDHYCDWTAFRRILWNFDGELPSMRFQIINRRSKNPTFILVGLPEEIDIAVRALQTEYDEWRQKFMDRQAKRQKSSQPGNTHEHVPAEDLNVRTTIAR